MKTKKRLILVLIAAGLISSCGGDDAPPPVPEPKTGCPETGVDSSYACKSGLTEPLYPFQWALNFAASFFKSFPDVFDLANGSDLNVETVHQTGIKGQGVNVLVLDDGVDIHHEDLKPNVNPAMTYNFGDGSTDPTPPLDEPNKETAHGTHVAGIIAAAQNSLGVMGIAPRATLGGSRFIEVDNADELIAYGGANWSRNAHLINASYGNNPSLPPEYTDENKATIGLRGLPKLRDGKGTIFLKAAGNEFRSSDGGRLCPFQFRGIFSCDNTVHDTESLEPNVINVAAVNAKGIRSSYSSASSMIWISGLGGEYATGGDYGEKNGGGLFYGPTIFSTDLRSCDRGYAYTGATGTSRFSQGLTSDNQNCDYSHLNGTSAATPTLSGVTALILQANPNLTWRDVREILRRTAKRIDPDYGSKEKRANAVDLTTGAFTDDVADIGVVDGATSARLDLGWVRNQAGYWHSNWYGFGLADAQKAVDMAKEYAKGTYRSLPAEIDIASDKLPFTPLVPGTISYGKVSKIGEFVSTDSSAIDQFQIQLSGDLCVGSVGFYVKSARGTWSILSQPYNVWYQNPAVSSDDGKAPEDGPNKMDRFTLGTYAFYGESAAGKFEIYAVAGTPRASGAGKCTLPAGKPSALAARIVALPAAH